MSKSSPAHGIKEVANPTIGDSHYKAISPLDGRYYKQTAVLSDLFSEYAFTRYRIFIELSWLKHLASIAVIAALNNKQIAALDTIYAQFDEGEFAVFKKIEETTRHDVKAIEYYLQQQFRNKGLSTNVPFIHLGLTSDDINNLAYALILKENKATVLMPELSGILQTIKQAAEKTKNTPLLARTHGQPAVPTTFGKELAVYYGRIAKQFKKMVEFSFEGKCNGAVGNYNALQLVYPEKDWIAISRAFILSLGLEPNLYTTQILPYDNWVEFFQIISRLNMILVDCSLNMWLYIMNETVSQKRTAGEVGSSTMPQKINPIHFENTEGNLQVANSYFDLYQRKLSVSRLQRDLSDSTVRRTFGEAFGYTLIGWKSFLLGLNKVSVNGAHAAEELNSHWEVLSEALQTILRTRGDEKAYEKLKKMTQGVIITQRVYLQILKELGLDKEEKLIRLRPETYTGLARTLTELALKQE